MQPRELIPHLFRTEFAKISAVQTKIYGLENLEQAEDVASESFLAALETWPYKGIPENPSAWLYTVAKNKMKNHLQRTGHFQQKVLPQLVPQFSLEDEAIWSNEHISDSTLQMMFALSHPSIPPKAQIGLILRILCGFGIDEIAAAFLENPESTTKRLKRARQALRNATMTLEYPSEAEVIPRLQSVLKTLYLLFSEGYYSERNDEVIREEFCFEAIRLVSLLIDHIKTALPEVHALLALMCFQASRLGARKGINGEIILYDDQDVSLWDQRLISLGAYHFHKSAAGSKFSPYHLEAGIAYWYTVPDDHALKWANILDLYNHLLTIAYSPIAALNRTYAYAKVYGKVRAAQEAEKLNLKNNHYYYTLLGYLYMDLDNAISERHFQKALSLAKTSSDKIMINRHLR